MNGCVFNSFHLQNATPLKKLPRAQHPPAPSLGTPCCNGHLTDQQIG